MEPFDAPLPVPPALGRIHTQIDHWTTASDPRAVFLRCYAMMTGNVVRSLADGHFEDGVWVDGLLHRFAGYYFDALEAYDADPARAPAVWRLAHEATRRPRTSTVQHLLLGINAHINYDLVLTLVDVLDPEWARLDAADRERRLADHRRINAVIAQTLDAVQDEVVEAEEPAWHLVDCGLGRMDEWIAARLIADWRDEVWTHAVRMLEAEGPEAREAYRGTVEAGTLERAEALLLRGSPLSWGRLF